MINKNVSSEINAPNEIEDEKKNLRNEYIHFDVVCGNF
jgi:hypothetical protein